MSAYGRHKKKNTDLAESMIQLVSRAVDLYEILYDDREGREDYLPSIRFVAQKMNTTILRVRKLLITAEFYSTEISRTIQDLFKQGLSVKEIMEETKLGRASVYSYIPYQGLAFNLDQTTVNADRKKLFRRRKKAAEELLAHLDSLDAKEYLWKAVVAFEKYPFLSMRGIKFSYEIKRGRDGLLTGEIVIDRMKKKITRSTVNLAFHKALEIRANEGYVSEPKRIGGFGASYLYPLFLRLGLITRAPIC